MSKKKIFKLTAAQALIRFMIAQKVKINGEIKPLFPNEKYLVIQKTPNIRFHLVGYSNIGKRETDTSKDFIGVHYDGEFGHPETEINIIFSIYMRIQYHS